MFGPVQADPWFWILRRQRAQEFGISASPSWPVNPAPELLLRAVTVVQHVWLVSMGSHPLGKEYSSCPYPPHFCAGRQRSKCPLRRHFPRKRAHGLLLVRGYGPRETVAGNSSYRIGDPRPCAQQLPLSRSVCSTAGFSTRTTTRVPCFLVRHGLDLDLAPKTGADAGLTDVRSSFCLTDFTLRDQAHRQGFWGRACFAFSGLGRGRFQGPRLDRPRPTDVTFRRVAAGNTSAGAALQQIQARRFALRGGVVRKCGCSAPKGRLP